MRQGAPAFVDSGACIAVALSHDPLHVQAREQWELLRGAGAKLYTSVPVVIETFHFLTANRDLATWKEAIHAAWDRNTPSCDLRLERSWEYFRRGELHKLSAVDGTTFTIMKRARIGLAYTFDHHFAVVGFRFGGMAGPYFWAGLVPSGSGRG
jgi:predicted nucleic acid-binding protein